MSLARHARFYLALIVGAAVLAVDSGPWTLRILLAGNGFYITYLALTAALASRITPDLLRRHAAMDDEGVPVILLLSIAVVTISLGAIFLLLREITGAAPWQVAAAILGIPLGWFMLHTPAAFHYANLYYAPGRDGRIARGLDFPGEDAEPGLADFLYFSLVVGMTAQVSDVVVRTAAMRRVVLVHGVLSFFYNTMILALAVNAAAAFVH